MLSDLIEQLRVREEAGLKRRRQTLDGPQTPYLTIADKQYLAFCSNDYLGLANHPELIKSACEGAQYYGVGAGASHLISGHSLAHEELEQALAHFVGLPNALLFSAGYMANIGIVMAFVGRGDAIFADKLNHASLNDAAQLTRAKLVRFPHLDMTILEQRLSSSKARRKLVITDSVFSMDGDIAPIKQLLTLCEKYNAMLLLDDAHGFGVLGKCGQGCLFDDNEEGLYSPNLIYMATLGKAAGVFGAFVAAQPEVIETLIQTARSYIYTTAAPALLAHILLTSLKLIEQDHWRREKLMQHIVQLNEGLQSHWALMSSRTPIQPLLIGESVDAVRVSDALRTAGILVPAIRPPTVPQGTARLRISLSAAHHSDDIERLIDTLLMMRKKSLL